MTKTNKKSQKNLIAALQLCATLDKNINKVPFSKFNLSILSFLCHRGFVSNFKFFKEGSNGYILFSLRRINGSIIFKKIWSPLSVRTGFSNSRFFKYQSYKSLLKSFTSEFVILSTNKGLMTINEATAARLGGSIICVIT